MKVFHLSHHHGCIADFEYAAGRLGVDVVSATFDDGYNIGADRADRAWERWKDRLTGADVVLISDTAPLARIVLQHLEEFRGRLVIWVCNRFDYHDAESNDCAFPDPAYYDLVRRAADHPRVDIAVFTPFESHYARERGVELGDRVIKPVGRRLPGPYSPSVPDSVEKEHTLFVPPYVNDTKLVDVVEACRRGGHPAYSGRYGGPQDLRGFRAIVHIPYSWSTFALFEAIQNAIPVFVPRRQFLLALARNPRFWWPDRGNLGELLELSEWYAPEHGFLTQFASWPDLWWSLGHTDLDEVRRRLVAFGRAHEEAMLRAWADVLRIGAEAAGSGQPEPAPRGAEGG